MGVVSNGMLCSGDELGLTADADGILILPADTPLGRPLADLYGDIVLDVDVKPNRGDALSIVGLAREVAAVTGGGAALAAQRRRRAGRPIDRAARRSRSTIRELCPRFVGRWVEGVTSGRRRIAVQMRLLAAGMRPISNVVDASNYVMVELGKPIHTFDAAAVATTAGSSSASPAPGSGSRRSTTSSASSTPRPCSSPTRPGRIGIAGVMGGAASEVGDGDDRRHRRVGDLRPDEHPPDRVPLRAPIGGEPALREGPGVPARAPRRGPHGPADRRVGRRRGRARARRHRSGRAGAGARRVPAGARRPAARDASSGATSSARCSSGSAIETDAGRARTRSASPPGPSRSTCEAGRRGRRRGDRPDLASRSRDRGGRHRGGHPRPRLRHGPADACPTRRCRRSATIRSRVRDAVRETLAGAGLTEVVTYALVAPKLVERFPALDDGTLDGEPEQRAAGRPVVVTNPLSQPAFGAPPEPRRQPARGRVDEPAARPRRRRDLRGRQGLRRDRRRRRRTSGGVSASP